jgi:hypothetical protein
MSIAPTLQRYLTAENIQDDVNPHDPSMSFARTAEACRISGGSFGQGNGTAAQCRLYARRLASVVSPSPKRRLCLSIKFYGTLMSTLTPNSGHRS